MIKLTHHVLKDRWVVNTPASHVQRQPRVYATAERAAERIQDLMHDHGCQPVVVVTVAVRNREGADGDSPWRPPALLTAMQHVATVVNT